MDYTQEIKNSINFNILDSEDIYDFRGSDFEELLFNYYSFCRQNLDIQTKTEPISPNILIFTNSFEINARAGIKNKHFVIAINLGLFQSCVNNYYANTALSDYFQTLYPNTISKFDNPVNILAFQICTQFSYYHELAHLFQLSNTKKNISIQERNDQKSSKAFDKTDHILEINADTYASIAVTTHIEQYISKTFEDDVTFENTMETFIFFGCCLLNYTLNFSEKPEDIYFEKHEHPHSFIRQLNTVLNVTHHLQNSTYFKKAGIIIDGNTLFLAIINIYTQLETNGVFQTNVKGIIENNKYLSNEMVEYLYSLIQFETTAYRNAMDVWNKGIVIA